ncbi:MAG: 23S rRNA (guanosine(2251)-2'-O)-methyltransferase RlmB [Armatimonadetes bacterium 13_1_40CM_64_14]|nr:MAG: 23S rRNA (guanosine(2251)-2'-O)-methyltransferase RlmB [Armatimonadetes bacterium 13_1_40CM_64_14]
MPDSHDRSEAEGDQDILPGRRAVLEALRAGRPLRKVLLTRAAHGGTIRAILQEAKQHDIFVQFVDERRLDHLAQGAHHQGAIALTSAKSLVSVDEILASARHRNQAPFVLVVEGVEDPANLGALIRTADGAGVHGIIIPRHRAVGLTPTVARTSAGALEHLPVAQVTNISRALDALKDARLWVVGADPAASTVHYDMRLLPPVALVLGGEGRGLSRLVRERCDALVRLPMRGRLSSLNVSVAGGILLYEVVRQLHTQSTVEAPP